MRHGTSGARYAYSGCHRAFPSQEQLRSTCGDEKDQAPHTRIDFSLILCCPHSEDHTQPLIFTTWLQLIASTSTFASGSMANHTNEMYLCTFYVSSTVLVSPASLEHQCRSSATSRAFILSLHFHHCEAPWKWLKGNTGTEAVAQLFH